MKIRRVTLLSIALILLLACSCPLTSLPVTKKPSTQPPLVPTKASQTISTAPPPARLTEPPFTFDWNDRSPFEKNVVEYHRQTALTGLAGATVYHIAFSIADPPTSVSGIEEVRYTNNEDIALTEVNFAVFSEILGGTIQIDTLKVDDQQVEPIHSNGIMRVPLASPLGVGKSVTFQIEFQVTVPAQGGGYYYGIFGFNDGILSLAHAYPTILVYNEEGWNNEPPDLDGDPLFSDTSFYLVSVNAPADLVMAASGVEIQRSDVDGRQVVLYADGPARDFYLAASTDFNKTSAQVDGVTINSYTLTRDNAYTQSVLEVAKASLADFSQRYAPYPYTELDIIPIVTDAGGVEFPGLVAMAENVYGGGSFQEVVVTHEVGHQWFYNLVGNDTQDQPWLDESLAEFVTWQYYLDVHGPQGAQEYRDEVEGTWNMLGSQDIPIGQAVSDYSSSGYVSIVYGRGPLFFLALRDEISVTNFDSLMQDYTQAFTWKIATTADFKALAEKHCACDLTHLFDEWVTP
jgi:hypothetical protein